MHYIQHANKIFGLVNSEIDRFTLLDPSTNRYLKTRTAPREIKGDFSGFRVKLRTLIGGQQHDRERKYFARSAAEAEARAKLAAWRIPGIQSFEILATEPADIDFKVTVRISADGRSREIRCAAPSAAEAETQALSAVRKNGGREAEVIKTEPVGV